MKMAFEPSERFNRVEQVLRDNLSPALTFFNANPTVVLLNTAMFGIEMIFRFLKLGSRIKKKLREAEMALDQKVRSEGIFRIPIHIGLQDTEVITFFLRGECQLSFPEIYRQMKPEIDVLINSSDHAAKKDAFDSLKVAYRLMWESDVLTDKNLAKDPFLDDLIGKWIDPGNFEFRDLVLECKPFLAQQELSISALREMLPDYARLELNKEQNVTNKMTHEQLLAVNDAISEMTWDVLLHREDNSIEKTMTFLVTHRIEVLHQEITELETRRDQLSALPPEEMTPARERELVQLNQRLDDKALMKERLESVDTQM